MFTLEEIAQRESRIVLDTSFMHMCRDPNIALQKTKEIIRFLDTTSVIIISDVTQEFEPVPRGSKKGSKRMKTYINKGNVYEHHKKKDREITSQTSFFKRLVKRLRERETNFSPSSIYQSLFQTLCYLADNLKIKDPENRTDESVVATAFFLTYCSSTPTAVLSNDIHFSRLSQALVRETAIPEINTSVGGIINLSKEVGVKIYKETKMDSREYKINWDSTKYQTKQPELRREQQKGLIKLLVA